MEKTIAIRGVDKELWQHFLRLSRRAGFDTVGECLNELLFCVISEYEEKPEAFRKWLFDCKTL